MSKYSSRNKLHKEYGQSWVVAAALWESAKTPGEITDHLQNYFALFGLFNQFRRDDSKNSIRWRRYITDTLDELVKRDWVEQQGECYALTPIGRKEAGKSLSDMRKTRSLLHKIAQPETVSVVGIITHLGLVALKLPAALLSGSVGLLNDALDTLLDGISSLLVFLGLRFDKERVVNIILVLLMLTTGSFTFYEAVRRFFVPLKPEVDWFTFLAAIFSAVCCFVLWIYQHYVGMRSGKFSLITQSIDSRNHVIVAVSVTAGLVASLLQFQLLDTLVGLAVAGLILKSGVELAIDLFRSMGQDQVDIKSTYLAISSGFPDIMSGSDRHNYASGFSGKLKAGMYRLCPN